MENGPSSARQSFETLAGSAVRGVDKMLVLTLRKNHRGVYLIIEELAGPRRHSIVVPASMLPELNSQLQSMATRANI